MDEALARVEEEVVRKQTTSLSAAASKEEIDATTATLAGLERSIQMLKRKKAEGRMIVRILPPELLQGRTFDIEMQGGDALHVPSDPSSVNILGSVYNPTSSFFIPAQSIGDYLEKVGGITQDADDVEIYVVKADGTVQSRKQASSFLFYDSFMSTDVESGDTIVVPQKIDKTPWVRDVKDITTILAQLAISAGTVILGLK